MVNHEAFADTFSQIDQIKYLSCGLSQWFLYQNVLAGLKRLLREWVVSGYRSCDYDSFDSWIYKDVLVTLGYFNGWIPPLRANESTRIEITGHYHFGFFQLAKVSEQILPPIPASHDSYS
jgi:hypothetical protein